MRDDILLFAALFALCAIWSGVIYGNKRVIGGATDEAGN